MLSKYINDFKTVFEIEIRVLKVTKFFSGAAEVVLVKN